MNFWYPSKLNENFQQQWKNIDLIERIIWRSNIEGKTRKRQISIEARANSSKYLNVRKSTSESDGSNGRAFERNTSAACRHGPNNQTQSSKTSTFDRAKCSLPTKISARSEISWKNVKVLIMKQLPETPRMSVEWDKISSQCTYKRGTMKISL